MMLSICDLISAFFPLGRLFGISMRDPETFLIGVTIMAPDTALVEASAHV